MSFSTHSLRNSLVFLTGSLLLGFGELPEEGVAGSANRRQPAELFKYNKTNQMKEGDAFQVSGPLFLR